MRNVKWVLGAVVLLLCGYVPLIAQCVGAKLTQGQES